MSPVSFHNFRVTPTDLDLNGPVLSFLETPESVQANLAGIATFVGVATASFPGNPNAVNSGTITYRWYDSDGALTDGANITGSATTTLTLSNVFGAANNGKEYFLRVNYTPGDSTGNANNEPFDSDNVTTTVVPTISFTTQPGVTTVAVGEQATFIAIPEISDTSYTPLLQNWTVDGVIVENQSSPLISGAGTTTLIIEKEALGVSTVQSIAYVESDIGRIEATSDVVDFSGVSPRNILKIEGYTSTNLYDSLSANLDELPDNKQTIDNQLFGADYSLITFYAAEKSMDVKITLTAAKGTDSGIYKGGQGGLSVITTTLEEDVEYTLIGISNNSAIFLYRGSNLIGVVGSGGNAGTSGNGGDGGGMNVSGADGGGQQPGSGAISPILGTLSLNGIFGSVLSGANIDLRIGDSIATTPAGGRTISCSKGDYWTNLGIAPCANNSTNKIQFVNIDGTTITDSDEIIRGFKPGYTISNTSGQGINNGGNGGNGATGGQGGTTGSGGGGGSGYTDGSVTIQSTNLGGNFTEIRSSVAIELI